jgi:hypothetical protein
MVCERGSSALEAALEGRPGDDVRAFVVWEPILPSDIAPPTSNDLARCHDGRARQFWDENHLVSASLGDTHAPRRKGIAWDYVAVYPPGATWDDKLPKPDFEGGPVVSAEAELRERLLKR